MSTGQEPGSLAPVETVLMALTDAYLLTDLEGEVLVANHRARRLLLGTELDVPPPVTRWTNDLERATDLLGQWRTSTAPRPATIPLASGRTVRADGARLGGTSWLLIRLRDRPQSAYASVAGRLRSEQLHVMGQRFDAVVRQLHDANRALRTANEELQQYAGAVAHDVRTPLFAIRGFAQLLQDGGHVDDAGEELVELILDAADRLHQTTESILAVARLEAQPPVIAPTPLRSALHDALADVQRELDQADAEVVDDDLAGVEAAVPAVALRQVFQNLVTNSLRFRDPSRPLRIVATTRTIGDLVEVTIADNGVGIEDHELEHLFELFQRGTRRSTTPGHGTGLATCRKLVSRWGGTIRCEPTSGPGARFTFTAPQRPSGSSDGLL